MASLPATCAAAALRCQKPLHELSAYLQAHSMSSGPMQPINASAQHHRCVAAAHGGPSPANPSRRRSQRLRERGANNRDLQRQLREV